MSLQANPKILFYLVKNQQPSSFLVLLSKADDEANS